MEKNNQNTASKGSRNKISVTELSLPKGGGTIKGIGETFRPDPFSGTASLSIPVQISPCRGFEPKMSLAYNSGSGNGIFGIGFSISVPGISRKTEKGIPKYDDTDVFLFSNTEDLVPKMVKDEEGNWLKKERYVEEDGVGWKVLSYIPRIEGLFAEIEYWKSNCDSYWKVTTRENTTSVYGRNENARITDPDNNSHVFKWLIEKTCDAKGNKIEYLYKQEDNENVPNDICEKNRTYTANKYISSIRYGNCLEENGQEEWNFEVVFDYGQYDISEQYLSQPDCNPYIPIRKWPARQDPFSSYRSGFEIRTLRLCQNILMFHHFKNELGEAPCLVKATQLTYGESAQQSKLIINNQSTKVLQISKVEVRGFKRQENGSYEFKSMPPLELSYSYLNPEGGKFDILQVEDSIAAPVSTGQVSYNFVDLYGDGIPGLLYSDDKAALYWKPKGNGAYGYPEPPLEFPIEKDLQKAEYTLVSLEGNGKLDLVVGTPQRGGFYECSPGGAWQPYRDFEYYPLDFTNPRKEMLDTDGDGLANLLIYEDNTVKLYPSLKKKGYGIPTRTGLSKDFPITSGRYAEEVLSYADMFGDGMSHRVRIRCGSVECWPNLGYGRFGKKVLFGNSPRFEGTLDASRLFFADLDGTGTTDIAYTYSDRIEIFLNQGGNSFSHPISIPLPEGYSNADHISFADVKGSGSACLIFTKTGVGAKHYYYNFSEGTKPYILTGIDNNLGALTRINYASSVKYYLEDNISGRPWKTKLPFPVQVVEKVESIDQISGSKLTAGYKYHDGFYDSVEREFRGFGFVEETDTEDFKIYSKPGLLENIAFHATAEELHAPPVYTKRWYHTGACLEAGVLSKQSEQEYYRQDKKAFSIPDSSFDGVILQDSAETVRLAYRALKGRVIREEVYALDNMPGLTDNPYAVTETSFHVREMQPATSDQEAVFFVYQKETVSFNYERNPTDPQVQQELCLEVDDYGNTKKSCRIFYPRRPTVSGITTPIIYPEQTRIRATLDIKSFINISKDFLLLGIPCDSKTYEINGLDLQGQACFSSAQVNDQVKQSLENQIRNDEKFSAGIIQARLLSWERNYFWNEAQNAPLPLGEITEKALPHHSEKAVFTQETANSLLNGKAVPGLMETDGGYVLQEGYWWNRGLTQHFFKETDNSFFLPWKTENSYAPPASSLYAQTVYEYDRYFLAPVKMTKFLTGETANVSSALIDYTVLASKQITDTNDNVSQVLFDPLGMVTVTSVFGTAGGKPEGDCDLKDYRAIPGENTTFDDVLVNPGKYLQSATTYFYYDLFTWKNKGEPACSIKLLRETHTSAIPAGEESRMQIQIDYSDGFGREIEKKLKTDPGEAVLRDKDGKPVLNASDQITQGLVQDRWIVSGRTVYNNKGKPVKQYIPYFSPTPNYELQKDMDSVLPNPTELYYDPMLRPVKTVNPKGFFTKIEFTPWEEKHFDENDTVRDSTYYKSFKATYPPDPAPEQKDENDALDKASRFYNTPEIKVLDNAGHTFLEIRNNLGEITRDTFSDIIKNSTVEPEELWNELKSKGYIESDTISTNGWVPDKFQPYERNFLLQLTDRYKQYEDKIISILKENCLVTYHELDIEGNVLFSADPRLYYSNIKNNTSYYNFKYVYDMQKNLISINSPDAGLKLNFKNIFGNTVHTWDSRGFHTTTLYDCFQRPVQINVEGEDGRGLVLNQTVEKFIYGELYDGNKEASQDKNLRGQVYKHFDQAGVITYDLYNIKGKAAQTARQFLSDYKNEANWNNNNQALQYEAFSTGYTYDALNRVCSETVPGAGIYTHEYNQAGLLWKTAITFPDGSKQVVVEDIQYNANSQRLNIAYGNGITTQYYYDDPTLRLTGIISTGPDNNNAMDTKGRKLQDIVYAYDPAGNVTRIRDNSYRTVFCSQQIIEPLSDYSYNALYQLVSATGRQHPGILADTHRYGFKQSIFRPINPPNLNDGNNLENYRENYNYDEAGNLTTIRHISASASWTRQIDISADSNRTVQITSFNGTKDFCKTIYDNCGNMQNLENLADIKWSYRNNISRVDVILRENNSSDSDYFVYDSGGQRVRKVTERKCSDSLTEIEEKIYLGSLEIKRIKKKSESSETVILDRQSLHVMDGKSRIAITDIWLKDDFNREIGKIMERKFRFQLNNHLGSSCLEADDQANIISYEEYLPYGGTSFTAGRDKSEVKLKEYRYCGKERDDFTGLYYYGARYYPPWLGRWINPDPAGTADGLNLYAFVKGNPIKFIDPNGKEGSPWLSLLYGGLTTLAVGLIGGAAVGTGNYSSPVVGALAGLAGMYFNKDKSRLGALAMAGAGMVGSIIGGIIGRQEMSRAKDKNQPSTSVARTGLITSGLTGAISSLATLSATKQFSWHNAVVGAVAGFGGGVLASGAHFGLFQLGDADLPTMPVKAKLTDLNISLTQHHSRHYLELNPKEIETNPPKSYFEVTDDKTKKTVLCDLVMVHGYPRYVFPEAKGGKYNQFITKEDLADLLHDQGFPHKDGMNNVPIKLVSCFGGFYEGLFSTAQTVANKLKTDVYASRWPVSVDEKGVWVKFTPS
ncbi:YD repeat protein [Desulfofarcimen acetoxidans DSM 771]|uniref:YD repeat protein n=1 Tax=Desulfofarcimen acetoxidans (strain ATCC 49208 / DSM 771 / KCTC 5769 / VKM B-1644 / 5575) TaxID=485916 RepID=C8W2E9_DESAS|nr:SpvB/TcaC N-terminal domain-containing protein [Desulfofarcimen acetoxidans]ACV63633.1 YD repeat protein [Desulfofarcimen acetoxidans DSM 771]